MFTLNNHFQKANLSKILSKRQILWLKMSPFGSKNKKIKGNGEESQIETQTRTPAHFGGKYTEQ